MFHSDYSGIWKVGPDSNSHLMVRKLVDGFSQLLGNDTLWKSYEIAQSQFKQTEVLSLNSEKI